MLTVKKLGCIRVGWGRGIGIGEKRLDAFHDCQHVVGLSPPFLKDVQANFSIRIDVRVEHLWVLKGNFRRIDRVSLLKLNIEEEDPALPFGIIGSENHSLPLHHTVAIDIEIDVYI